MTDLVQYLTPALVALVGWGVKATHSKAGRIEHEVHKINGRVSRMEQWTKGHEELDTIRFDDLKEDIKRLEKTT